MIHAGVLLQAEQGFDSDEEDMPTFDLPAELEEYTWVTAFDRHL